MTETGIDARKASPLDRYVGLQLKRRREQLGLSQTALAQRLGISFQQLQKYERGANRISAGRLFEVAALMDVDIAWFFDGAKTVLDETRAQISQPDGDLIDASTPVAPSRSPLATLTSAHGSDQVLEAYAAISSPHARRKAIELLRLLSDS